MICITGAAAVYLKTRVCYINITGPGGDDLNCLVGINHPASISFDSHIRHKLLFYNPFNIPPNSYSPNILVSAPLQTYKPLFDDPIHESARIVYLKP